MSAIMDKSITLLGSRLHEDGMTARYPSASEAAGTCSCRPRPVSGTGEYNMIAHAPRLAAHRLARPGPRRDHPQCSTACARDNKQHVVKANRGLGRAICIVIRLISGLDTASRRTPVPLPGETTPDPRRTAFCDGVVWRVRSQKPDLVRAKACFIIPRLA